MSSLARESNPGIRNCGGNLDEWLSILGKSSEYLYFHKVNQQTEPDWTIDLEDGPAGLRATFRSTWRNFARGRFARLQFAPAAARSGTRWPTAWRHEPCLWTTSRGGSVPAAKGNSTSASRGDP